MSKLAKYLGAARRPLEILLAVAGLAWAVAVAEPAWIGVGLAALAVAILDPAARLRDRLRHRFVRTPGRGGR